ncbi:hypothetical protein ACLB2K_049758 [Fragaria x ananassa]
MDAKLVREVVEHLEDQGSKEKKKKEDQGSDEEDGSGEQDSEGRGEDSEVEEDSDPMMMIRIRKRECGDTMEIEEKETDDPLEPSGATKRKYGKCLFLHQRKFGTGGHKRKLAQV